MTERTLVLSVTLKDCDVQTFRAGGNGGQNQNKRDTGVRIIHRASGARGEARDERSQLQNKRLAFKRMTDHPLFRA
jgi:protein subunit release factor B